MKDLFIFVQDNSCYGNIVVVAKTEEQARKLMENELNYDAERLLTKHDIEDGLVIANYGDL